MPDISAGSRASSQRGWLSQLIKAERARLGITQAELARRIGVSQPEVARWESGHVKSVTFETRELLAQAGFDRIALGLRSFDLEEIPVYIESTLDLINILNKPDLGLALISPPFAWLQHRANRALYERGKRLSDEELELLADTAYLTGLAGSLTIVSRKIRWSIDCLAVAEAAAHQTNSRERLPRILAVMGNEQRKVGNLDQAVETLKHAAQFASNIRMHRVSAEAEGSLAYANAYKGDKRGVLTALRRCEAQLQCTESAPDPRESLFTEQSLAEVRIRCADALGDKTAMKSACRNLPVRHTNAGYWDVFLAVTAAKALLALHNDEAYDWLEYAHANAVRLKLPGQQLRIVSIMQSCGTPVVEQLLEKARSGLADLKEPRPPVVGDSVISSEAATLGHLTRGEADYVF